MITLIIPTHNPRADFLERTLESARQQKLEREAWELLVIDNASAEPLGSQLVSWHPNGRIIREERLGLTFARLTAIERAEGDLLVWCDDDNQLDSDYLRLARDAFADHPRLGAAGGKSVPEYQEAPPNWYQPGLVPLGCRDLGDRKVLIQACDQPATYPPAAPIGAGMVTRRNAIAGWAEKIVGDARRTALGRRGNALSSGEDNDIMLTILKSGWDLAYLPGLSLTHLIPPNRLTIDYQCRIAHASFRDFVRVLDVHGIRPWPPITAASVPLRQAKAWLQFRAWKGPAEKIRWSGICGQYEGRALLD